MTKRQPNKQQGTSYPAGIKMMISVLPDIFWYCCVNFCYGASCIAVRVNCSSILDDASLLIIAFRTLTGLSERSLAVLMMVIRIDGEFGFIKNQDRKHRETSPRDFGRNKTQEYGKRNHFRDEDAARADFLGNYGENPCGTVVA